MVEHIVGQTIQVQAIRNNKRTGEMLTVKVTRVTYESDFVDVAGVEYELCYSTMNPTPAVFLH